MKKHFTQEPIKTEHLYDFLDCVINKKIKDRATAARVKRLSKYTTNLTDVAVVVEAFMQQQQATTAKLIDELQIAKAVMAKLGATPEMFQEAQVEYNEQIEEFKKQLEDAKAQLAKEQEEENSKVKDIAEEIAKNEVTEEK